MATIGIFKSVGDAFTGEIVTLTLQVRKVRIVPAHWRFSDAAISHRVFAGATETAPVRPTPRKESRGLLDGGRRLSAVARGSL